MVQNDETQYIARILDGDTECFSAFLDRYSRPLYVLIVQIVGCGNQRSNGILRFKESARSLF